MIPLHPSVLPISPKVALIARQYFGLVYGRIYGTLAIRALQDT